MSKCSVFTQWNMAESNILQEPESSAVSINEDEENEGNSEVNNYYYLIISQL